MGRKRNQGKARKKAKALAAEQIWEQSLSAALDDSRQEAEERINKNNQTTTTMIETEDTLSEPQNALLEKFGIGPIREKLELTQQQRRRLESLNATEKEQELENYVNTIEATKTELTASKRKLDMYVEFYEWLTMPEQEDIRAKTEVLLSSGGDNIRREDLLDNDTFLEINTYYRNQTGKQLSGEEFQSVLMMAFNGRVDDDQVDDHQDQDTNVQSVHQSSEENDDCIADTNGDNNVNTPALTAPPCMHGVKNVYQYSFQFVDAFRTSFVESIRVFNNSVKLLDCLNAAHDATIESEVWKDSVKLKMAISITLCVGTTAILEGNNDGARVSACIVRYFEEHIAVELERSRAQRQWTKICEASFGDMHTLVKFFSKRTPCSCLDEKYKEVKDITKMSFCFNPQCTIPGQKVERSKIMSCGRCQSIMYCSRECQKAHWRAHKSSCNSIAKMKAEFEAKQQNM